MTYESRTYVKNGFPPKEVTSPAQAVALEFDGYVPVDAEAPEQTEEEAALSAAEAERFAVETEPTDPPVVVSNSAPSADKTAADQVKVPSPSDVAKAADKNKD